MPKPQISLLFLFHILPILFILSEAADDVLCLRGLQSSLNIKDPSWNFSNSTVGFVCSFTGVSCWNQQENRVQALNLPDLSLSGQIPSSLQYCSSLTSLDLSENQLGGPIPPSLCQWLPNLVTLDLSRNQITGPIPPDLSACQYLNNLNLAQNHLTGNVPTSLVQLNRLVKLDLSSNLLIGTVPQQLEQKFGAASFADNSGLCTSRCGKSSMRSLIIIIAAGVLGAVVALVIAYLVWRLMFANVKRGAAAESSGGVFEDGRRWAERLRSHRLVPVSLFQKPIVKVKLGDLLTATADFHPNFMLDVGSSRLGSSYKAVLRDGSALTVKRLNSCLLSDKQFRAEMGRIGQLRHPNLVPLLGFCVVEEERLLVYKHMPLGGLSSVIELSADALDWASRVRIMLGAARGLAWLHHGFQIPYVHQNLSSRSVLLNEDYEARITDFGLAKLVSLSGSDGFNTSPVINGDLGEFGYVAPEYATNPVATTKGDVYTFGIILLELVTGQKPVEITSDAAGEGFKGSLVDWVNGLARDGKIKDAIDACLQNRGSDDEIIQVLKIALTCLTTRVKERPTMYQVYMSLKTIGEGHDMSEQFDDFPLLYGKEEPDNQ